MLHRDPQLISRDMLTSVMHGRYGEIPVPGIAIKLSETPGRIETPGPDLGEHNDEIFRGLLGLSEERYGALKSANVI
jgi:formyl-CoA transferase